MDYLREINAFERWLETNYLPCLSQLLWYRLIALCNRAGWPEWVAVDNYRLMGMIQCKREATLIDLRGKLIDCGLIELRKGKKGSPNQYKINTFTSVVKSVVNTVVETEVNSVVESVAQTVAETVDITSYPTDTQETKTKTKTKTVNARAKPQKNKYAEFVSMTNDEYSSLVAKLGEQGAGRCVEILDNYKGANGKKYASDYRAILNWVVKRYEEEAGRNGLRAPDQPHDPTVNPFERRG